MISKAYENPDFEIIEFSIEDVLTSSEVIHTTTAPSTTIPATTLPSTTIDGVLVGKPGQGDIIIKPSEYFQ